MHIAVVGTGLAGLAVGWHLLKEGCQITFFDERELGQGASGVAAGLVHPYAGEKARRSQNASESLAQMEELLALSEQELGRPVIIHREIIRIAYSDEQRINLKAAEDVEEIAPDEFLIRSGMTVDVPSHLQGLFLACQKKGARHILQKVPMDGPLDGFDHTVFACGSGWSSSPFARGLPLKPMKGQVLLLRLNQPLAKSHIAKGYLARTLDPRLVYLGATYERRFTDEQPCMESASQELLPRLSRLLPSGCTWEILGCRAGVRLCRQGDNFPFGKRIGENCWWLAGLGSKGLLYHAYLAKKLVCDILTT